VNLLSFGAVFTYTDGSYIYLASNGLMTYAAKIVPRKNAHFVDRYENIMRTGSEMSRKAAQDNRNYCFVELITDGYSGEIAHLERTDDQRDEARFTPTGEVICRQDMQTLKKEILDGPMPRGLKKRIKDIEV
jgi:hypothetical protein